MPVLGVGVVESSIWLVLDLGVVEFALLFVLDLRDVEFALLFVLDVGVDTSYLRSFSKCTRSVEDLEIAARVG